MTEIHEVKMETRTLQTLLFLSLIIATIADFTSLCPEQCKCFWGNGNKQADCSQINFEETISKLSSDMQILNLTGNELLEIKKNAFEDASLINLKKLILKECKLTTVHEDGLRGLSIMVELDLSKNNLIKLEPDTFKDTSKIRWILLNDNKLEKLEDGLFNNLLFLQKIDLTNNYIKQIGVNTFINVPKFNNLKLGNNKLETLNIDSLNATTSLSTLELHQNPWRCDCLLLPLRNWVVNHNLYTSPISCAAPATVQGRLWRELDSSDFTCTQNIVDPLVTLN